MWLNEIGIEIGYARLSHYIGQLRRREEAVNAFVVAQSSSEDATGSSLLGLTSPSIAEPVSELQPGHTTYTSNPLANIIEREHRRPGFDYNSEPDIKKLI